MQFVPARMLAPTVRGHAVARGGRGIDIPPQDVTAARKLDVEGDDGEDRPDGSELEVEDHPDDGESTCSGRSGIDNAVHMGFEFERLRAIKTDECNVELQNLMNSFGLSAEPFQQYELEKHGNVFKAAVARAVTHPG